MSERDTHFQGGAQLLFQKLVEEGFINVEQLDRELLPRWRDDIIRLIAQYNYDLVWHTIHAIGLDDDSIPFQDIYRPEEDIPDLTKWPDHS